MSEVTPTPEELVEEIRLTVNDANVIPTPIDPTLSHQGEAADAKATGDAIAGVISNLRVNTKAPSNNEITVYASDILMSNAQGAQTVAAAIESAADKDASEIMYDAANFVTIKAAIDGIKEDIDAELSTEEIDAIIEEVFGGDE